MAEVESMQAELGQTIEAWNYANIELDRIEGDLATNAKHLAAARTSLDVAQRRIQERVRDLYINGEGDSTLEVILGSRSLDDIIMQLDAIERVSSQDTRILHTVKRYRSEVETRRASLKEARSDQARIVASVKDDIAEMRAEEQRRQAALAAQASARVQAQQLAAQAQTQQTYDTAVASAPSYDANLPPARYGHVVAIAMQYLGVPYVWGGASPSTGFDCSGFTMYVYAQVGVSLPHHAASQYQMGTPVPRDQLAPGDLVFFSGLGHMGMYIGGGQFIHAPQTGDVVKISSMADRWDSYVGARRI